MTVPPSFVGITADTSARRRAIAASHRANEKSILRKLLRRAAYGAGERAKVDRLAHRLVINARKYNREHAVLDAFLSEYSLGTQEGVVLMCLAEALLRIPDADTRDRLIQGKFASADWDAHFGRSHSTFVNAATVGLLLTGKVVRLDSDARDTAGFLGRLVARTGEPIIRRALVQAMHILGHQFVMGRTIGEALERAVHPENRVWRYSFDMLGEAAMTAADAARYHEAYGAAIDTIGAAASGGATQNAPEISVKLSALHPRYSLAQRDTVMRELVPRLADLAADANHAGIGLTVDAEEADRLDISLDVIEAAYADSRLADWDGFGLAVQAYSKRALPLIDWIEVLAKRGKRRINVRLVKGAYWDTEIKRAQEQGLDGYPVFTSKAATDVSYIACVRRLFEAGDRIYPQFATHNAHTVAAVQVLAPNGAEYEFQRLHGMGEALYRQLVGSEKGSVSCCVYAPVGSHEELLPYLVRRLLENGANTSFVNRLAHGELPVAAVIADPVDRIEATGGAPNPRIPAPRDISGDGRRLAAGIDLSDPLELRLLSEAMNSAAVHDLAVGPIIGGEIAEGTGREATDPACRRRIVGTVLEATPEHVNRAVTLAARSTTEWDRLGGDARAEIIERAADALEADMPGLMTIAVREGGKTIPDALSEIREAVDFCRYYAGQARHLFSDPYRLPGPTGEENRLSRHGRGVFVCISPWNFPAAIFTGQVTAALAAGNAVIAKPAEQTPLLAGAVVRHLHQAGVPPDVLHLLPGKGSIIGEALINAAETRGVVFTGSTETAQRINIALAARNGPLLPLIAETGGQNAMIVDSSALPEQVVRDVLVSAFNSAGQRCSALRVLYLQDEVADRILTMLSGAMAELVIGDPGLLSTDIGPVIDRDAQSMLERHAERMTRDGRLIYRCILPPETETGTFFAPTTFEIDSLSRLDREIFGPILHVIRYRSDELDRVIDEINGTGYGLTAGIHSRVDETIDYVCARLRAGNTYVNRTMIGAVVGMQPFGGEGLSGTGPKAGGPDYLLRFGVERTVSTNTAAMGGNVSLLSGADEK